MEFKGRRPNREKPKSAVLIESDWNLKQVQPGRRQPVIFRINRIRLEFKGMRRTAGRNVNGVLIESDWNLKQAAQAIPVTAVAVLIESDWNLKCVDDSVNRVDSFWY